MKDRLPAVHSSFKWKVVQGPSGHGPSSRGKECVLQGLLRVPTGQVATVLASSGKQSAVFVTNLAGDMKKAGRSRQMA